MKEAEYNLPYNGETIKAIDDVINNEEVGVCITDFNTNRILFINSKMETYADKTDIVCIIGKSCPVNKKGDKNTPCPSCSHTHLIDKHGNLLDPYIREQYIESMDIWLKIIDQAVELTNGRLIRIVIFSDISETQKMREQLTDYKFKDRLLGVKNGLSLEHDVQKASVKPSLLLFEVESMEIVNEFYGWEKGNHLLCTIRDTILSKNVPDSELYRIGGDRFCLAISNISRGALKELAHDMSALFTGTWNFEYEGMTIQSFNDVAIAVIHGGYIKGKESLLCLSKRVLTKAKERKEIVVYNKKMDEAHKYRLKMEWDIKKCVHENMRGFDVFYQPIINSSSETWCGLEALCRWNSPELGAIPPAVFIPEIEQLELIDTLGLWVLETAVSKCKAWELDFCGNFILNINLSAMQFNNENLADEIIGVLKKYNFPGEKLCIEITESTNVTFLDRSLRVIEQLREHDMLVALDDFGTGYSSFSRLKNMPVDIVKIERMFVSDIENNEYHRYLFQVMTDLAHAANMKLIVEGVESKRQMNILVKDGADLLQGYLFSRPLPPKELENKLIHFYSQAPAANREYFMGIDIIEDAAI